MKPTLILCLLFAILTQCTFAQKPDIGKITDSLVTEGKALYKSEMASWYGTDVFVDKCKDKRPLSGGYFSYDTGAGVTNLFFSKGASPVVLATITFDYTFSTSTCKLDTVSRKLTANELALYTIRQKALQAVNTDTLFKHYRNTDLNLIPIIHNGFKRVYILTGPQQNGLVILGNDYLIEFNDANEIASKRNLHKNPQFYRNDPTKPTIGTVHSHLPSTGDFITATDICTLMLYEKSAGWKYHVVVSKNYVSSWDCQKDQLVILTREAWDKMNKAEEKKEK